jgi:hypothetical protein
MGAPMSEQTVIELRQKKEETKFLCSACGADRLCNCNAPAIPKAQKAIEALKTNPEKSNRAIADEIGADKVIVDRARKRLEATGDMSPVVERTGLDSKIRKVPAKKAKPKVATDSPPSADHRKPGDYWSGQDCGGNWYVSVVTDEMGPATWKSKDAAGPFKTEAEAQAWIVGRGRKSDPQDNALESFDAHILELLRLTKGQKPACFAKTAVATPLLGDLAHFFRELVTARKQTASTEAAP